MVEKKRRFLSALIFLIGLVLCSYSLVSSIIARQYQIDTVATYNESVNEIDNAGIEEVLEKAHEYNSMLYQSDGILINDLETGILSDESYNSILNISGTGVMGSIKIPKISVNLPIYHGTSNEAISAGAGHVEISSLPVGGENTRTILTSHRGLPNAKLFTRLDELKEGDLFFINVLNETLAYQICEIEVINPEEIDKLKIQEGKDLATLVTCTPYGINTHRLIVTGERVEYDEAEYEAIEPAMMSFRELALTVIPFVFVAIGIKEIVKKIKERKKRDAAKTNS